MRVSLAGDPKLFNYSLTGQTLEEVLDVKYLGVTLSNDFEWSKHIATITNKANSKLSFLCRNLMGCPAKLKHSAYVSLVCSFMEYGVTVWDTHQNTLVFLIYLFFYLPYPTLQFSRGVWKGEKANGL